MRSRVDIKTEAKEILRSDHRKVRTVSCTQHQISFPATLSPSVSVE